jgi:hypothetical protein
MAAQILCHEEASAGNPDTFGNCGRAQLAVGRAYLALRDPRAAKSITAEDSHHSDEVSAALAALPPNPDR